MLLHARNFSIVISVCVAHLLSTFVDHFEERDELSDRRMCRLRGEDDDHVYRRGCHKVPHFF